MDAARPLCAQRWVEGNEVSRTRLPEWLKGVRVLQMCLRSCVKMSRCNAEQAPAIEVHQFAHGKVQFA